MCLYDAFKDNRMVPWWLQQGRNGLGPNYVYEGPHYMNQTPQPPRLDDGQTLVPTPITCTNPLPPTPPNTARSHHRDSDLSPLLSPPQLQTVIRSHLCTSPKGVT